MLISPDNHLAIMAFLVLIVGITIWAERFKVVQKLSVAGTIIVVPMILSNLGLIPREAPTYGFVMQYFIILAIPLLLFKADLKRIFSETGRLLIVFFIAAGGTLVGAFVAYFIVPLGELGAQSAAAMTGGFIGGGMNFVAVSQAVELTDDPTLFSTVLGAETVAGIGYLVFLAAIPAMAWFQRMDDHEQKGGAAAVEPPTEHLTGPGMQDMAIGLGLSLAICAAGIWIAAALGIGKYNILIITVLAVIAANIAPRQMARLKGDADIGMFLLYVFFAVYGAGTNFVAMIQNAPLLLVFGFVLVAVHFLIVLGLGRLTRFSMREIAVASNACVLGPPTAAALAAKEGWDDLVTPGVLCGILGYVIGNFLGVSMYAVLA